MIKSPVDTEISFDSYRQQTDFESSFLFQFKVKRKCSKCSNVSGGASVKWRVTGWSGGCGPSLGEKAR